MSLKPLMDGERRISGHGRVLLTVCSILLTVFAGAVVAPAGLAAPVEAELTPASPLATPVVSTAPVQLAATAGAITGFPTVAQMSALMSEMHDLSRLMQATMTIMQVLQQGQPTADEIAALQAQVKVLGLRMNKLMVEVQAARATTAAMPTPPPAPPPLAPATAFDIHALHSWLAKTQQAADLLRGIATDPSVDRQTIVAAELMLGQLEGTVTEMRDLISGALGAGNSAPAPLAQAPGVAPLAALPPLLAVPPAAQALPPTPQALPPTSQALPPAAQALPPTAPAATPAPAGSMMDMMSEMMAMMSGMMGGMMGGGGMGGGSAAGAPAPGPGTQPVDPALVRQAQAGAVSVKVYPTNLHVPGLASLDFYLTLETHSVSLAFDLAQSATLRLPSGLEVQAVKWVGPVGGHHVEGTLSFPALDSNGAPLVPVAGNLTLVIRNIPGATDQSFVWDLAQTP